MIAAAPDNVVGTTLLCWFGIFASLAIIAEGCGIINPGKIFTAVFAYGVKRAEAWIAGDPTERAAGGAAFVESSIQEILGAYPEDDDIDCATVLATAGLSPPIARERGSEHLEDAAIAPAATVHTSGLKPVADPGNPFTKPLGKGYNFPCRQVTRPVRASMRTAAAAAVAPEKRKKTVRFAEPESRASEPAKKEEEKGAVDAYDGKQWPHGFNYFSKQPSGSIFGPGMSYMERFYLDRLPTCMKNGMDLLEGCTAKVQDFVYLVWVPEYGYAHLDLITQTYFSPESQTPVFPRSKLAHGEPKPLSEEHRGWDVQLQLYQVERIQAQNRHIATYFPDMPLKAPDTLQLVATNGVAYHPAAAVTPAESMLPPPPPQPQQRREDAGVACVPVVSMASEESVLPAPPPPPQQPQQAVTPAVVCPPAAAAARPETGPRTVVDVISSNADTYFSRILQCPVKRYSGWPGMVPSVQQPAPTSAPATQGPAAQTPATAGVQQVVRSAEGSKLDALTVRGVHKKIAVWLPDIMQFCNVASNFIGVISTTERWRLLSADKEIAAKMRECGLKLSSIWKWATIEASDGQAANGSSSQALGHLGRNVGRVIDQTKLTKAKALELGLAGDSMRVNRDYFKKAFDIARLPASVEARQKTEADLQPAVRFYQIMDIFYDVFDKYQRQ